MFQIYHRPLLGIATCSLATLVSTPLTASGDDAFEYTHVEWANGPGANGHWYVQVKTAPAVITWDGAYIMAEEMGGHLVTITSAEEDNLVHESFAGCITSWAGGFRSDEWQWVTGEPWSYTNWYPGEPNGSDGSHLEVIFKCDGWNDMYASYQRDGFIVEFEADCNNDGIVDYGQILDGTLADANTNNIPDCCEDGSCIGAVQWREVDGGNGHWYQAVVDPGLSWNQAFELAGMTGGHLATLNSASENTWVYEILGLDDWGEFWHTPSGTGPALGGTWSPGTEWVWITGEDWAYENFGDGGYPAPPASWGLSFRTLEGQPQPDSAWQAVPIDGGGPGAIEHRSYVVEWSADCNGDGIVDYGQILDGSLSDHDGDGIPDCCTQGNCDCPADLNQDRIVNGMDLSVVLGFWGTDAEAFPAADLNHDGVVDGVDLTILLGAWGSDCS